MIKTILHHSRTSLALLAFLIISGLISYFNIPKESAPDVKIPVVYVSLHQEGISPQDGERLLIRPVEQHLKKIEGVKEMRSTAYKGGGNVILEFFAGYDLNQALQDVRENVNSAKTDLPKEADEPSVSEVSFSQFPVLIVKLSGDIPNRTLYALAQDLQEAIESEVSTVIDAEIVGDREEVLEIVVDPTKLETMNVSLEDVVRFFQRNNIIVGAGSLDKGRFSVSVPGLIERPEDVFNFPLKTEGNAQIKFSDVASIRKTYKDATSYARDRGTPVVALEITKRTGENIIETIENVKKVVSRFQKQWPQGVKVDFSQDQSKRIIDMLNDLQNNLISAVLLVMAVIVFSMGWRSALLVGLAVPGSFLTGILFLSLMGYTLNIVVLFSLILAVGMLVDGTIIVVEYADRKMAEGHGRFEAYAMAAERMFWPVVSSISTILAVFLPLLFWPGVVGQFMKFLPITLLATLTASIVMAIVFVPSLAIYFAKISLKNTEEIKSLAASESGNLSDVKGWTQRYIRLLDWSLDRPYKVMGSTAALLVTVFVMYSFLGRGVEFFPNVEPDDVILEIHARGNMSIDERDHLVKAVEERLFDMKELKSIFSHTGAASGEPNVKRAGPPAEDVIGDITLEFVDWKERRPVDTVLADIENRLKDLAGYYVEVSKNKPGPPIGKPVQLEIVSDSYESLPLTAAEIRAHFETMSGLTMIEDSRPIPGLEWEIAVNRAEARKRGADIALVGMGVQLLTNGVKVASYRPDKSITEVDVILRYPEAYRSLDRLSALRIQTSLGLVPLSSFVEKKAVHKVNQINRVDGHKVMTVKADVLPGVLASDKVKELRKWLTTYHPRPGISIVFKGEDKEQKETGQFLGKAFGVALFLILLILVTQFNSFYSAGLVLSAVVMSTIGVFLGLLFTHQAFGIVMGGIGVIALAGIIVSNNIILIDTYDQLKHRYSQREAILRTGAQRLRPVILTKLTTVLGLLPIMFGLNIDFVNGEITQGAPSTQWWIQLSSTIVYGVLFASALTLVVTPCALMVKKTTKDAAS